ncbi:hypothetical protein Q7P37_001199 [Cladosporium fusiforme]
MSAQDVISLPSEAIPVQPFIPQPNSTLLHKLPGELRNRIYRLVLVSDDEVTIQAKALTGEDRKDEETAVVAPPQTGSSVRIEDLRHNNVRVIPISIQLGSIKDLAKEEATNIISSPEVCSAPSALRLQNVHPLLQACKQIRHEAPEIYYLENVFQITTSVFQHPHALEMLSHIFGPWATKMTELHIKHEKNLADIPNPVRTMTMDFSVYRAQGRLHFRGHESTIEQSFIRIAYTQGNQQAEDVEYDVGLKLVCTCKFHELAHANAGEDVVQFVARYAEMVSAMKKVNPRTYIPHCWSCACGVIF